MSRVFIGRLADKASERDVERFFKGYGRIKDIRLKTGYGFVEFESERDADDAIHDLHNKELVGGRIVLEHARSGRRSPQRFDSSRRYAGNAPVRTDYRLLVENLPSRVSWQDLKDLMRKTGEVMFADAHKRKQNEGIVEFKTRSDLKAALKKFDGYELSGRKLRVYEDNIRGRSRSRRSASSRSSPRKGRKRSSRRNSSSPRRSTSRSRSKSYESRHSSSRSKSPVKRNKKKNVSRSRSPVKHRSTSKSKTPLKNGTDSRDYSKKSIYREKSKSRKSRSDHSNSLKNEQHSDVENHKIENSGHSVSKDRSSSKERSISKDRTVSERTVSKERSISIDRSISREKNVSKEHSLSRDGSISKKRSESRDRSVLEDKEKSCSGSN